MLKVYNIQMTLNQSKNQPQQQHKEEKSQDFKTLFIKMYKGEDNAADASSNSGIREFLRD